MAFRRVGLFAGGLFAGALFAGALFGPQAQEVVAERAEYHGGGLREDVSYDEVYRQWELLALRTQPTILTLDAAQQETPDVAAPSAPVSTFALSMPLRGAVVMPVLPQVDAVLAGMLFERDAMQQAAMLQRRNEEAMLLILAQLDDDEVESVNITISRA